MSESKADRRTYYNSCYEHGVDEKHRVQIPAKWRPEEEGVEFTVILWPQHQAGTCLRVLPPEEMASLMADLDNMPNGDPKKIVLKRLIGSESVQLTVDKGGRICLSEGMKAAAGIKEKAVLVGLLDRFEIWSPDRYEKVKAADAVLAHEAFKMME
jgi:MraZ protein